MKRNLQPLAIVQFLAVMALSALSMPIAIVGALLYTLTTPSQAYASFAVGNPQQYPTLEQFAGSIAAVLGKIEVIEQELYDRIVYPLAGIAQLLFFQNPKGAGFSSESGLAAAAGKSDADTNMTQNGQLPAPQAYWIDNIQVDVDPGSITTANLFTTINPTTAVAAAAITNATSVQDKNAILNAGWLQLSLGTKPYYQNGPLAYFPPRAQKRIDAAIGNSDTTTHNALETAIMWVCGQPRTLDPGLGLATGFNFQVAVNFPVLVPTVTNNARIKVLLGGWLFRAAQ